jgi:biopolymer transport protein ExbB
MNSHLFHLFAASGPEWVTRILVGVALLTAALIVNRAVFFHRYTWSAAIDLAPALSLGLLEEVTPRLARRAGLEIAAVLTAIEAAAEGPTAVEQAVASVIARERPRYERWLSLLATLGGSAPLLGLLGTAAGAAGALSELAHRGAGGDLAPAALSVLSQALAATAVGLLIAIPALVASRGFRRRLANALARAELLSEAYAGFVARQAMAEVPVAAPPPPGMRARRRGERRVR